MRIAGANRRARRRSKDPRSTDADDDSPDIVKRPLKWLLVTVVAAVIGGIVTFNTDLLKSAVSNQDPLDIHATRSEEVPKNGYSLVVGDPESLPANTDSVKDCAKLWSVGLEAGGIRSDRSAVRILLHGNSTEGVTITDMRAVAVKRAPSAGGVLLDCPSAGGLDPIGLTFDLSEVNTAQAQHIDDDNNPQNQFVNGYAIGIAEKEAVPLVVDIKPSSDAIWWHIEADAIVGGERQVITIDDEGKDFYSPGVGEWNSYAKGFRVGVAKEIWGLDDYARRTKDGNGSEILKKGRVSIPWTPGIDIYQPAISSDPYDVGVSDTEADGSPHRWVRYDGRRLIRFSPPGSPAYTFAYSDMCYEAEDDTGYIRKTSIVSTRDVRHGLQDFKEQIVDVVCNIDRNVERDGHGSDKNWWKCGGTTCPEETFRLHVLIHPDFTMWYAEPELSPDDLVLAERILQQVGYEN
jgi:hypothetical protein